MCDGHEISSSTSKTTTSKQVTSNSRLSTFKSWNQRNEADEYYYGTTRRLLKSASIFTLQAYVALLVFIFTIAAPKTSFRYLENTERMANGLVMILLVVTNGSKIVPLFLRENFSFSKSGVLISSCTVQGIAISSLFLMSLFPTPVLTDVVTGMDVPLVRWIEWTVLSFLMSFLTDSIDLPIAQTANEQAVIKKKGKSAWAHGIAIGLSTFAGLLFPFCTNLYWWMLVLILSCVLFSSIYIRLYDTHKRFSIMKMKQQRRSSSDSSRIGVEEQEHYDRVRLSLRLLQACTIMWTALTIVFILYRFIPKSLFESVQQRNTYWVVTESVFEVSSKIWYLSVVMDVHSNIFDEDSRALRRLQELREMMSYVWENSSDMIALSLRSNNCITTIVSPTFLHLPFINTKKQNNKCSSSDDDRIALVLTMPLDSTDANVSLNAYDVNLSSENGLSKLRNITCHDGSNAAARSFNNNKSKDNHLKHPILQKNIDSLVELLGKAWKCKEKESLLVHDLYEEKMSTITAATEAAGDCQTVKCEAKVSRMEYDAVVVILRDISERFRRFEAEKKLVVEVTERKKDAEANRFTRHEVKNGLLAAIGLVDSLKPDGLGCNKKPPSATELSLAALDGRSLYMKNRNEDFRNETWESTGDMCRRFSNESYANAFIEEKTTSCDTGSQSTTNNTPLDELDTTLRQVLDTVLSEAMARDVIHEVYEPNMERIDVCLALQSVTSKENIRPSVRFPMKTFPNELPEIILDPQILRYIHRNAVSNACKYGKPGGVVTTVIQYDEAANELLVEVTNEPGACHDKLVQLKSDIVDRIFSPGYRLHQSQELSLFDSSNNNNSTSDVAAAAPTLGQEDKAVVDLSSGDGAWIMQKCANALGGKCCIRFEENQTVFSMTCPARASSAAINVGKVSSGKLKARSSTSGGGASSAYKTFKLPSSTWGVAIDDSPIQRKLLNRFLSLAKIRSDRRVIVGKDATEVLGFNKLMKKLLKENPHDKFLVIVDENLDIAEEGTIAHKTVSGSLTIEMLRNQLDPHDERRLLTLIRSANDSGPDITLYKTRAHGFIPKAPIKKDGVLELIHPLWVKRFNDDEDSSSGGSEHEDIPEVPCGIVIPGGKDLVVAVQVIDNLIIRCDNKGLSERWPAIWDKLHSLKGDIKAMKSNARVRTVIEAIEKLRGEQMPNELVERWKLIKALVISLI